jgi:RNA polymerase sigma-70 factor, ECF subfamily
MGLQRDRKVPQDDSSARLAADASAGSGFSAWQLRLAVVRHYRLVYRVAYGLLMDRHEAEDVTQEAFLRLWQHGANVRGTREWLLTVARNACLDRLRKVHGYTASEPDEIEPRSDERGPAWHFDQQDLARRLQALIGTLPEPQRSLVVLFDVHGQSGEACSRILGLSVNQVKVYLHRARRRLRRELEKSS